MKKPFPKKFLKVKRGLNGLGLFATVDIKKGTHVIDYTGELITSAQADTRGGQYLFEVSDKWTVDGSGRKNLARYINHSCRPNCETEAYERAKRIEIAAKRNIMAGEELTYDYGKQFWNEYIRPKGCNCEKCGEK